MGVATLSFNLIALDFRAPESLQRQLTEAIRGRVLSGEFPSGARLPATRAVRRLLGVGRNTVLGAYEQLAAEGYLCGRHGSGTYVSENLPDARLRAEGAQRPGPEFARARPPVSPLAVRLRRAAVDGGAPRVPPTPFRPCIPSVADFPLEVWERLRRRILGGRSAHLLHYADPAGYRPLREAIAAHIRDYRGVRCRAEQIIVTAGAQHAFSLILGLFAPPGSRVGVEDPGYHGFCSAAHAAGARVVPVPVDGDGMAVSRIDRSRPPSALYVTPSRQFPLGVTMALSRRFEVLEFAERTGCWVIEDDYDSEHRYSGRPLPALQGLTPGARVLYVGTFSKTIYPSLRLGFIVAPEALVDDFARARTALDAHSPSVDQAVLAEFLAEGHFARHLRRTQALYGERLAAFQEEMARLLGSCVRLEPAFSGLSVVGWLPAGADDAAWSARARTAGIDVPPLSSYRLRRSLPAGAVFGFAAFPPAQIRRAVAHLAAAWPL